MRVLRVGVLIFTATATAGCAGLGSWCQELVVGEAVFTGNAGWFQNEPIYTRVVATFDRGTEGIGVPTVVRVGRQTVRAATATAEGLTAAGVPELTTPNAPFRMFGVRVPDRDAGITIDFHNGRRLRMVGMSCWPGVVCDFAIGWGNNSLISLPASESELVPRLPTRGVVRECVPAF
jgi:hypothetical protein